MAFNSDSVQVFLTVLDHGSFSAAARALSRVPSAVSMTIAHLEAELDVQLFDRSGREPRPTAAARALEPQARLLAGQLQLARQQPGLGLQRAGGGGGAGLASAAVKQLHIQLGLQVGDGHAHGRRHTRQGPRGGRERAVVEHGQKHLHAVRVEGHGGLICQ